MGTAIPMPIGAVFGYRTIVGEVQYRTSKSGRRDRYFPVRCACGVEQLLKPQQIVLYDRCFDCSVLARRRVTPDDGPPVGQRYGSLLVVGPSKVAPRPSTGDNQLIVPVRCDCGKEKTVTQYALNRGTRSCGCSQGERVYTSHLGSKTRLYRIWTGMKKRCGASYMASYPSYGGRGIRVAEEWQTSFETFRDWALAHGYEEHLTIDRIDPDGHYEPANCRWITQSENSKRKRKPYSVKRKMDA